MHPGKESSGELSDKWPDSGNVLDQEGRRRQQGSNSDGRFYVSKYKRSNVSSGRGREAGVCSKVETACLWLIQY